jgi:peptide deformylase
MIETREEFLRIPCEDASLEEAEVIIKKLDKELKNSKLKGIGLSAPQIGIHKKVAIVRVDKASINLVNPEIIEGFDLEKFEGEGCLSYPNRYETTMRYRFVVIKNGIEPYRVLLQGMAAIVAQHEIDHLRNVLLPDVAIKC